MQHHIRSPFPEALVRSLLSVVLVAVVFLASPVPGPGLEAQSDPVPIGRFAIHKTLQSSTCSAKPTLRDHEIVVRTNSVGRITIDDGNGVWAARMTPDGNFTTDPRSGELADGTRLDVVMSGSVSRAAFEGVLQGTRGPSGADPSGCRYAIQWVGTLVPDSAQGKAGAHR